VGIEKIIFVKPELFTEHCLLHASSIFELSLISFIINCVRSHGKTRRHLLPKLVELIYLIFLGTVFYGNTLVRQHPDGAVFE
jgi:hypothetical protein